MGATIGAIVGGYAGEPLGPGVDTGAEPGRSGTHPVAVQRGTGLLVPPALLGTPPRAHIGQHDEHAVTFAHHALIDDVRSISAKIIVTP
jgi:hypothetical protein